MTTWQEFEQQAPDLAPRIRARFTAHRHHVLATLKRDGSPRVSGTEVDFRGGELFLGSMAGAVKAADLRVDGGRRRPPRLSRWAGSPPGR
ncbi:hypothetical protein ACFY00_00955 [Kitasatospora sp. NPDC001540]|uniref:hypothetical protein n=1 Tax=Kitasatospora sp. NPDC001540 TaxID=3364014 RepID=UPI003674ACCF